MLYLFMVIFGLLFLLVGIPFLIGAFLSYKSSKALTTNGIETQGLIIDIIKRVNESTDPNGGYTRSITYTPKIEFEDLQGHKQTFISNYSSSRLQWKKGDQITIIYNPDNPKQARIKRFWPLYGLSIILAFIGATFSLSGLIFVLWSAVSTK